MVQLILYQVRSRGALWRRVANWREKCSLGSCRSDDWKLFQSRIFSLDLTKCRMYTRFHSRHAVDRNISAARCLSYLFSAEWFRTHSIGECFGDVYRQIGRKHCFRDLIWLSQFHCLSYMNPKRSAFSAWSDVATWSLQQALFHPYTELQVDKSASPNAR